MRTFGWSPTEGELQVVDVTDTGVVGAVVAVLFSLNVVGAVVAVMLYFLLL